MENDLPKPSPKKVLKFMAWSFVIVICTVGVLIVLAAVTVIGYFIWLAVKSHVSGLIEVAQPHVEAAQKSAKQILWRLFANFNDFLQSLTDLEEEMEKPENA